MGRSWDSRHIGVRSYNAHYELGQHLASIAPRADWQAISPLFNDHAEQFDVQPADAGHMARAFKALAPLANPTWTRACHDLAASAAEAHRNQTLWHWS